MERALSPRTQESCPRASEASGEGWPLMRAHLLERMGTGGAGTCVLQLEGMHEQRLGEQPQVEPALAQEEDQLGWQGLLSITLHFYFIYLCL